SEQLLQVGVCRLDRVEHVNFVHLLLPEYARVNTNCLLLECLPTRAISYATPDDDEDSCCYNSADQRHAFQQWLTDDVKVEKTHDQKNGEQAEHNRPQYARWCATTG